MKTELKLLFGICAAGLLTGCETSGWSRRERSAITYPNYVLALKPAGASASARQVQTPIRVAVAQVGESAPPVALTDTLRSSAVVESVFGLPAPGEPQDGGHVANPSYAERLNLLCGLAAAANADYLFLCGGDVSLWRDPNALKFLDLTLVGAYAVPSTRIHGEGKAAGALVDVRTQEPLLFVNVEAKQSLVATTESTYSKQDVLSVELRNELARKLAEELQTRLVAGNRASAAQ